MGHATAAAVLESKGNKMTAPSRGEAKLIEGIKEVVKEVTAPRFNNIDEQLSELRKDISAVLSRLPRSPAP